MSTELDRKLLAAVERLGRAWRAAHQRLATRHELSLLGVSVLETLSDGRSRRVGDLAAELDIAQPTLSDALVPLGRRRLVHRRNDPADRRATVVTLSDAGEELAHQIATELAPLTSGGDPSATHQRAAALRVLLEEIARLQSAGVITIDHSCLTCRHYQPAKSSAPAHCILLDTPLANHDLRVHCRDHESASAPS